MKTKIFSLILLTTILFAVIATAFTAVPSTITFDKQLGSQNITLTGISTANLTLPSITVNGDNGDSIPLTLTNVSGTVIQVTASAPSNWNNFKLGQVYSTTGVFNETGSPSNNYTVTFSVVNGFCKAGNIGKLEITELEDNEVDNVDAWEWHPFDDVSFDVEVYNGFVDKERVKIEYELHDSNGKKVDFNEESNEQSISINDGDYEKVTFALKVPTDIDDGDYNLFIKAYLKSDESEGCVDKSSDTSVFEQTYYQRISVDREEDRAVIIDKEKLEIPSIVTCGDIVSLSPKIYNIGIEDEDRVKVVLYNKELGVDLDEVINNLDTGESATVDFSFKVPENVQAKTYIFNLVTNYEYDEDDDEYDSNSKSDLEEDFDFALKVNCIKEIPQSASITAELVSEAISGEQLLITGTIKNTGINDTTYSLSATGYSSWATFDKIDPSTISLKAGESKDFDISLNINGDVEGEQFLTITASYDGKTTEQKVSVLAEAKQGVSGITGAAITENIKKNWFIWVIVVINIILIVAIIAVARRIVKSR